jgi:glycosyltransferase involved in cell wall biosynthesis
MMARTPARNAAARPVSVPHRPLHVVQISRDADLLRPLAGSEPVERQLAYARELDRQAPASVLTIIVVAPPGGGGWQRDNAQIVPVGGFLRGCARCLKVLRTLHRRTPISVITTQVPYDEAWLALALGRWHGIPVIGQIHSDLFAEHAAAPFSARVTAASRRWATRKALRAFAVVRTVSSAARTSIAAFAGTLPVVTIPVPVPMVASTARPASAPDREPRVIFVGRLAPEKDLGTWLAVARAVSQQHPSARFEVVGDGPERGRLEQEAERLGLGGVLSFTGFVPHAQLGAVYGRAAVLLLTSQAEGFGRVLVEAASQGVAAVSTAVAGPRDIIIHGVTGFLHEPGDVEGLARSVSSLLEHPLRAAAMGARAQTLASARFDPARLRAAWVNLWITTADAAARTA